MDNLSGVSTRVVMLVLQLKSEKTTSRKLAGDTAVVELPQEKTVIMIAHRLKTVRHADQILVVDKGKIVQRGTHDELMDQDGIYRHFITGREQAVGWKL